MSAEHDEESQPLLGSSRDSLREEKGELIEPGVYDIMQYKTLPLTTWRTFSLRYAAVWRNPRLWEMMMQLSGMAIIVSILTILLVPNPAGLKVGKFTDVSKFLNVVVGLLLGFFLSSSMTRWHACVQGFMSLGDAVRNVQIQFVALGVPEKVTIQVLRYGYSSAWLLWYGLLIDSDRLEDPSTKDDWMWQKLGSKKANIDKSGKTVLLTQGEIEILKRTRDPPYIVWTWIAVLLGRLAQDGWIPPMNSPTYGRIMNLCQSAHAGLRDVAAAIEMQAPLPYVHMLATLLHINNILNAITFGVVSGCAIGTALVANDAHFYKQGMGFKTLASIKDSQQDWQNMAVTFLYCFFGPLIYQAMLLIGMGLAQPFNKTESRMPLDRLIHALEVDMCNSRDAVDSMDIEKPYFKAPPAPKADCDHVDDGGE